MNTILFRGKDKSTGKWVTGSLYSGHNSDGIPYHAILTKSTSHEDENLDDDNAVIFSEDEFHVVDSESVGQYIMNDKNDMPIFEGDIIRQDYDVKTSNMYGKQMDQEVHLTGYHVGVARLTADGAKLCNVKHFENDGTPSDIKPHRSHRIQIRSYRAQVIGNLIDNPSMLS